MRDRSNDKSAGARTQVEDGGRVVAQQLVGRATVQSCSGH